MATKCEFRKQDGTRCRANAQPANGVCVFHDPAHAEEVGKARRAGGISRSSPARVLPADAPDLELKSSKDVGTLLSETISQVRRGQVDPRICTAIGYLSSIVLRALEHGVAEDRLLAVEVALGLAPNSKKEGTQNAEQIPKAN